MDVLNLRRQRQSLALARTVSAVASRVQPDLTDVDVLPPMVGVSRIVADPRVGREALTRVTQLLAAQPFAVLRQLEALKLTPGVFSDLILSLSARAQGRHEARNALGRAQFYDDGPIASRKDVDSAVRQNAFEVVAAERGALLERDVDLSRLHVDAGDTRKVTLATKAINLGHEDVLSIATGILVASLSKPHVLDQLDVTFDIYPGDDTARIEGGLIAATLPSMSDRTFRDVIQVAGKIRREVYDSLLPTTFDTRTILTGRDPVTIDGWAIGEAEGARINGLPTLGPPAARGIGKVLPAQ